MSQNAVAIQNSQSLIPTSETWNQILQMGKAAYQSGLIPSSVKSAEAAAIIMMRGYELGLPPMLALDSLYVVNNKIGVSADMLLAKIRQEIPEAEIEIIESTEKICKISAKRPGEKKATATTYTIEEAKEAGLLGKDNWRKHPADMLFARCVSRMKRRQFNEVMKGLSHTPEELEDIKDVTPKKPETIQPSDSQPQPQSIQKPKNYAPQTSEEAKNWKPGQEAGSISEPNPAQDAAPKSAIDERTELAQEVGRLAKLAGYNRGSLEVRLLELYNKAYAQMTIEEIKDLVLTLNHEIGSKKGA